MLLSGIKNWKIKKRKRGGPAVPWIIEAGTQNKFLLILTRLRNHEEEPQCTIKSGEREGLGNAESLFDMDSHLYSQIN